MDDSRAPRDPLRAPHLREAVLGAIDGTVTTFAIVAGVAGAGLPVAVILALGAANVIADGFSMAAGVYSGGKADMEHAAQRREGFDTLVTRDPEAARRKLSAVLAARGLRGAALDGAVAAITSSRATWVALLAGGEAVPDTRAPLRDAAATFSAFLTCGMIPLLPFALGLPRPFLLSAMVTALLFAGIGALRSRWSLRGLWASAFETLLIGGAAAILAFAAGRMVQGWGVL